ncbi:hypothetical protein WL51_03570 [Burkholderia ubonensis]|uniref:encapsulin n=1 Tax=Burkholderia ubonensis TaxID=101571 RepID=UPI0007563EE9|nr:encapsulin [Burkholderia ubonensis]KWC42428.1 hypothetical protein WL51_03570 [Burkholderia ubonensis]
MNNSNEVSWEPAIWQEIRDAIVKEVAKLRIAQKVFPTVVLDNDPTEIPNDVIDFTDFSIQEGRTKPFVEVYQEFPLTNTQVNREAQNKTCKTLARMAAKAIALAEDTIIFQGETADLPANVKADLIGSTAGGLLGVANPEGTDDTDAAKVSEPINVEMLKERPGILYGENVFAAVADGISKLISKAQAPNFALFLPTKVYADTFVPPSNASLVTTAERIKPLVEGGFYGTGTLPPKKGLLVALAGDPTSLFVGQEATIEYVRKEGSGKYFFRVVERVQFVARDPRAFVLLNFE